MSSCSTRRRRARVRRASALAGQSLPRFGKRNTICRTFRPVRAGDGPSDGGDPKRPPQVWSVAVERRCAVLAASGGAVGLARVAAPAKRMRAAIRTSRESSTRSRNGGVRGEPGRRYANESKAGGIAFSQRCENQDRFARPDGVGDRLLSGFQLGPAQTVLTRHNATPAIPRQRCLGFRARRDGAKPGPMVSFAIAQSRLRRSLREAL